MRGPNLYPCTLCGAVAPAYYVTDKTYPDGTISQIAVCPECAAIVNGKDRAP